MCKMRCFQKNSVSLHSLRDVAQLVAHYVRDVGVASSSPVTPTKNAERGLRKLSISLRRPLFMSSNNTVAGGDCEQQQQRCITSITVNRC